MIASAELEPVFDTAEEYRAIEAALLETARGRWFLSEHSRRSRRLETSQLESAISQLKSSMREPPALLGRLETELAALKAMVEVAKASLTARDKSPDPVGAPTTSASLLGAAEQLHELVWSLQSDEIDADLCERIGRQATSIFALTAKQAEEARRAQAYAKTLDALADRVSAVLETILLELQSATDELPAGFMASG